MLRRLICAILCLLFLPSFFTRAEGTLSVSLPETVKGYTANEIRIVSPSAGRLNCGCTT